jgi:phosphomevalonate kinase
MAELQTVVSAPGKVMVAGGYVVLERPNAALVAAVSARIYAVVKSIPKADIGKPAGKMKISVLSVQLEEAREYVLHIDKQWTLEQLSSLSPNPYIESSVLKSLMVIYQLGGRLDDALGLSIFGDNAFYSIPSASTGGEPCPRFAKIARKVDPSSSNASEVTQQQQQHAAEVQKTGLGSSAALVTAIVGALLSHSGLVSIPCDSSMSAAAAAAKFSGEEALALVHNLSQLCHCAAQVFQPIL